ncbi:MAG: PA-phosphatase [Bacteroidetes bacterium]|nr:PA-phosphatase [Bacteroidota bacterium]
MNRRIANFFSYLFQPLMMASFLFAILLWLSPMAIGSLFNIEIKRYLLFVIFLTTFVIPMIGIIVMKLTSNISNYQMVDRKERVLPFLFISFFYGVAAYLIISRLNISNAFNVIFITLAALVLISTMITLFWKISIHSIGMCGVLGFLLALNLKVPASQLVWTVLIWVLCSGFTMSSRLYLNVHKPMEIYLGAILGFLFCFLAIYVFV